MKLKLLLVISLFVYIDSNAQEVSQKIDSVKVENYAFQPPKSLQDKSRWKRISDVRFECGFLRLAVEYREFEYVLLEMDGDKRVLEKSPKYTDIAREISRLTLRSSPGI